MPENLKVTCIDKPQPTSPYEAIRAIGGDWGKHRMAEAVYNIMARKYTYSVGTDDGEVEIKLVKGKTGYYLRSEKDGIETNNLLNLEQCQ